MCGDAPLIGLYGTTMVLLRNVWAYREVNAQMHYVVLETTNRHRILVDYMTPPSWHVRQHQALVVI